MYGFNTMPKRFDSDAISEVGFGFERFTNDAIVMSGFTGCIFERDIFTIRNDAICGFLVIGFGIYVTG